MRGREFLMKDMYSFDISQEDAYKAYDALSGAYHKIFDKLEINYAKAEADSGNIGGLLLYLSF
jgi:prolyl-tRNA synthetase